jgi:cell division protein DivIC
MDLTNEQKTKKLSAAMRRRRLFVFLPLVFLLIWSSVKIVDNLLVASDKKVKIAKLEQQLATETKLNNQYKQEISNLQDPEYREENARKELKMAKPGEKMFSLPESTR